MLLAIGFWPFAKHGFFHLYLLIEAFFASR
jgi:hypothetical protein